MTLTVKPKEFINMVHSKDPQCSSVRLFLCDGTNVSKTGGRVIVNTQDFYSGDSVEINVFSSNWNHVT